MIVRLIPSLHSFTHNRVDHIQGTDKLRLRACRLLVDVLHSNGIETGFVYFGSDFYIARRMIHGASDYCPPVEVIVKARHVGTPLRTLYNLADHRTLDGASIRPNEAHKPYVRFDYTNPLATEDGTRLKDECIPSGLASRFIDTEAAEATALDAFGIIHRHLGERGVRIDDICFKIAADGRSIFGEISPDCKRAVEVGNEEDFYGCDGEDASKDTFRSGASHDIVSERYLRFCELVEGPAIRSPVPLPC